MPRTILLATATALLVSTGAPAAAPQFDTPAKTAYLLTTNYRAILDYNCSNFYAISVGVLADAIARR